MRLWTRVRYLLSATASHEAHVFAQARISLPDHFCGQTVTVNRRVEVRSVDLHQTEKLFHLRHQVQIRDEESSAYRDRHLVVFQPALDLRAVRRQALVCVAVVEPEEMEILVPQGKS